MATFSAPLYPSPAVYVGEATSSVVNPPNTVVLDNRVYAISLENYSNTGLPSFRPSIITSNEPSDQLFNPDGGWWRYRFDWRLGAGQKVLDLGDDRLGAQFRTSQNVDIWNENELRIGPKVEEIFNANGTNSTAVTVYTYDDTLYMCTGNKLYTSTDYTFTEFCTFAGDAVFDMTFDGNFIWAISPTKLYKVDAATAAVTLTSITPTYQFDKIAYVGTHLLIGDGPALREILSGGASSSTVYTYYDTSFVWTTILSAGSSVYVGGHGGANSKLFTLTNITAGALALGAEATSFPTAERLFGGFGYGSVVLLQTSNGVRLGNVSGNAITYGPLLPSDNPVFAATAEGKYVWYGATRNDFKAEIIRADLETFTETLKPAYASEMFIDNANARSIPSMTRYAEPSIYASAPGEYQRYEESYTVFSTLEGKVYRVGGAVQTEGVLYTGEVFFGTAENKSLGAITVGFEPLDASTNERIEMSIVNVDTGQQLANVVASNEGQTELSLPATGFLFQKVELALKLFGDGTTTPSIRYWKGNAFPVAPPVQRWRVPLLLYNMVVYGDGQGQHLSMNPWQEIEHVRYLWRERRVCFYREGDHQYRVRVDNFILQPTRWNENGDWLEAVLFVDLLSV